VCSFDRKSPWDVARLDSRAYHGSSDASNSGQSTTGRKRTRSGSLPPIRTLTPSTTVTGSGVSHDPLVAGPGDQDGVITSVVSTLHDVATTPTGPPPGEKDYSSASDGPNDLMEVEPTCAPSIASPLGTLHDSIHTPTTAALTRPTLVNPPQGGIKSNHDSRRGGVTRGCCNIIVYILIAEFHATVVYDTLSLFLFHLIVCRG
jgi:hypothetical protein